MNPVRLHEDPAPASRSLLGVLPTETSPSADPGDASLPLRACLSIVIVYGDRTAAQRAVGLFTSLALNLSSDIEVHPTMILWHFDILAGCSRRISARCDAIQAHFLVIATSHPSGFPGGIARWLKTCLNEKRETSAALVALLGPAASPDGPESPRLRFLEQFATKARLDFFAPHPRSDRGLSPTSLNLHERAEAMTSTLNRILHRVVVRA